MRKLLLVTLAILLFAACTKKDDDVIKGDDIATNWKGKTYKVKFQRTGGNPASYCYYEENGSKKNERHFARNSSYTLTDDKNSHTYEIKAEQETMKFTVMGGASSFYLDISVDDSKLVTKKMSEKKDGNNILNFEYNFKTKKFKVNGK